MKKFFLCFWIACILSGSASYGQSINFSELNYNSDSTLNSGNWVELYNYGSTPIDLSGWFLKNADLIGLFTFPQGTTLQPDARLVVVSDSTRFHNIYPSVSNYLGTLPFTFGNDGDQVRLLDNTGTVKVFMEYADSTPWYPAADGSGRTLELIDAAQSPDSASNWFVGCVGGSPGQDYSPCIDPLVFDEINYHSDSTKDAGDWTEVWNHSSGYINLTGWSFRDSKNSNLFTFPNNLQLAPDARIVLVGDTAKFLSRHPAVSNWVGPFEFNLSNSGELIRLFDYTGKLKFSIVYNDHGAWPAGADGGGYTLELLDPDMNMNDPADWFTGCPEGSPGYAYAPGCNVGIEPAQSHDVMIQVAGNGNIILQMAPDDFNGNEQITLLNLMGTQVFTTLMNSNPEELQTASLARGLYLLCINQGKSAITKKILLQ